MIRCVVHLLRIFEMFHGHNITVTFSPLIHNRWKIHGQSIVRKMLYVAETAQSNNLQNTSLDHVI